MSAKTREFDTGANRNSDEGKLDYEAYFSPLVLRRVAEYMLEHSRLEDGTLRPGDNWQRGMPLSVYMKSAWRHLVAWWEMHRWTETGKMVNHKLLEDAICGVIFNASGYLHELVRKRTAAGLLQGLTSERLLREEDQVSVTARP